MAKMLTERFDVVGVEEVEGVDGRCGAGGFGVSSCEFKAFLAAGDEDEVRVWCRAFMDQGGANS